MQDSIATSFTRYFRFIIADTEERRRSCFHIRHQVYAEELGWENANSEGEECDEFDASAMHFLVQHKSSEHYAGTIRLVFPMSSSADGILPVEQHTGAGFYEGFAKPSTYLASQTAEVSRLAVSSRFRRRLFEQKGHFGIQTEGYPDISRAENSRIFPSIAIGLYLGALSVGLHLRLPIIFALMEARLQRRLAPLGLNFQQCGECIEFKGQRAPFQMELENLTQQLPGPIKSLYELIDEEIKGQLLGGVNYLRKLRRTVA